MLSTLKYRFTTYFQTSLTQLRHQRDWRGSVTPVWVISKMISWKPQLRVQQCVSQAYQTLQTITYNKLQKTARLTRKFKNHDCNPCFNPFQVCPSVSPLYLFLYLDFLLLISFCAVIFVWLDLVADSVFKFW